MKKIFLLLLLTVIFNQIFCQITLNFPFKPNINSPLNLWDTTNTKENLLNREYGLWEGQLTFVQDIDSFYVYDGNNWKNLSNYIEKKSLTGYNGIKINSSSDSIGLDNFIGFNKSYSGGYYLNPESFNYANISAYTSKVGLSLENHYSSSNGTIKYITGCLMSPNILYKSINSGATYSPVTNGGANVNLYDFDCSLNGQILLGITNTKSAILSKDYGVTWATIALSGATAQSCCMSSDGNIMFISSGAHYLIRSLDGGDTWEEITNSFSNYLLEIECSTNGTKLIGRVYGSGLIYYSQDIGYNWTATNITNNTNYAVFYALPDFSKIITWNSSNSYTYYSTDGGISYTKFASIPAISNYGGFIDNSGHMVICTNNGLYYFSNYLGSITNTLAPVAAPTFFSNTSDSLYLVGYANDYAIPLTTNVAGSEIIIDTNTISNKLLIYSNSVNSNNYTSKTLVPKSYVDNAYKSGNYVNISSNLITDLNTNFIESGTGNLVGFHYYGSSINSSENGVGISVDGKYISSAYYGTIYYSSDYGTSYSTITVPNSANLLAMSDNGQYQICAYSSSDKYVYYSTNYGATWNISNLSKMVDKITISGDGSVCYLHSATSPYYIYKSTDYGATWTNMNTPVTASRFYCGLKTNYAGNVIICGASKGIYKTIDGGATWSIINNTIICRNICMSDDGNHIIIVSSNNTFSLESHDGGLTWKNSVVDYGEDTRSPLLMSKDGSIVVKINHDTGLTYISKDYGVSYKSYKCYNNLTTAVFVTGAKLISDNNVVYMFNGYLNKLTNINYSLNNLHQYLNYDKANLNNNEYEDNSIIPYGNIKSYLGNQKFTENKYTIDTLSVGANSKGTVSTDGKYFYYVTNSNIWKSSDYGQTFNSCYKKSVSKTSNDIASSANGKFIYIVGLTSTDSLLYSNDYGTTWITSNNLIGASYIDCDASGKYILIYSSVDNLPHISNDYGNTWNVATNVTSELNYNYGCAVSNDGKIMACLMRNSLYVSTDYGLTWTKSFGNTSYYPSALTMDKITGSIYIGGQTELYSNGMYSNDYGVTWKSLNLPETSIKNLGVGNNGRYIICFGTFEYDNWYSQNSGLTWNRITNIESPSISASSSKLKISDNLEYFILSSSDGLFIKRNNSTINVDYPFILNNQPIKWDNNYYVTYGKMLESINSSTTSSIYFSGHLTDGSPTLAEINAILGFSANSVQPGYKVYIKDTDGIMAIYSLISDGNDWFIEILNKLN